MESDYDYLDENEEAWLEEPEARLEADPDIPDVWWKEDIQGIENPILREKEIEAAEALLGEKKELLKKYEDGEIDEATLQGKMLVELDPKEIRAATRCGLESVDLTWDHLGDIAEDNRFLATGDTKLLDLKDRVKEKIGEMGPDASQELADRMLEEGEISKDTHETISRQVRLRRLSSE